MTSHRFREDYFYSLSSQGNIYTLVPLIKEYEQCKFLIAILPKKILCLEYVFGNYSIYEVSLSIPNGADIISMDAFPRPGSADDHTVGVTYCKKVEAEVSGSYLDIYQQWNVYSCKGVDSSNVSSLKLNYIPYHLYHCHSKKNSTPVWLLSGSDCAVHLFAESERLSFTEQTCTKYGFPEFDEVNEIILRFDVLYVNGTNRRLTAMCGEKGSCFIYSVDLCDSDCPFIKSKRQLTYDFPVSSAKFFHRCNIDKSNTFRSNSNVEVHDNAREQGVEVSAVVATSLESCYVYRNIESDQIGFPVPQSDGYDVITCCIACDINFDGTNEILLGTYGQTVLIYEYQEASAESSSVWSLSEVISLPSPVLSLAYEDFQGEGIKQLIIHTMAGVHIYQHDLKEVTKLLIHRLRDMRDKRLIYTGGTPSEES